MLLSPWVRPYRGWSEACQKHTSTAVCRARTDELRLCRQIIIRLNRVQG